MTTVEISRHECTNDLLPNVCIQCGAPATATLPWTFSWSPPWSTWLVVAWLFTMRTMTIRLPLCDPDRKSRRRRSRLVLISLLLALGLGVLPCISSLAVPPSVSRQLVTIMWPICGGLFLVWLYVSTSAAARDVQPVRITERSIVLKRVHDSFVVALAEKRQRNDDANVDRRFGDLRDDFDDESKEAPRRNS